MSKEIEAAEVFIEAASLDADTENFEVALAYMLLHICKHGLILREAPNEL